MTIQVYAGTAGHSAWFSDDLGESFFHPNSHSGMYLESRVWNLASHPARPDRLFAATDLGLFRWDEAPARWTHLPSELGDAWAVSIDPANPDLLLAGTRPAGLWRSEDAGATWSRCPAPGIAAFSPQNMGPTRVTQILFDPVDAGTVWAGVEIGAIFVSRDGGRSFRESGAGLVSGDVHGLAAFALPGGGKALLATTNRGLHRSEDDGATWHVQELPSPWPYTREVRPRADDSGVIFLANGNGPPGNDGFLLRSRDHGRTWEDAGLPGERNSSVWCIAVHPADPMLVFVGTNLGQIFRSQDGGESWTALPHQFGELRALHWRKLPAELERAPHSITRPTQTARALGHPMARKVA